jgi:hypothetical protein
MATSEGNRPESGKTAISFFIGTPLLQESPGSHPLPIKEQGRLSTEERSPVAVVAARWGRVTGLRLKVGVVYAPLLCLRQGFWKRSTADIRNQVDEPARSRKAPHLLSS